MVQFVLEIAQNFSSIDILIVVDNNTVVTLQIFSSIFRFLQVNESICTEYGLEQASVFGSGKICSAWDKQLETNDIESQILNLLVQFEILNVQVKSSSRRQRRNRFLRLATNRSDSLTASLLILADHAFKMSRSMFTYL
ncbi:unnamed protein product [Rotaria socialis]|uniref:Uncharacterized protein n=1 Tax=Rotaria socialis TaxID=392032 RepID=A0A818GBM5_9BILA|nr:unnamed protein product [Rotaria socialis]